LRRDLASFQPTDVKIIGQMGWPVWPKVWC